MSGKLKILLAEDDVHISTIARLALEKLGGHQVTVADNGVTALELAVQGGYDVILLDEMMPKLNGVAVCRAYREKTACPVPVIFLSAKSQESDIREFVELSAGFIAKPFDPTQLDGQIRAILNRKKTGAA